MSDIGIILDKIIKSLGVVLTIILVVIPLGIPILLIWAAVKAWKK